MHIHIRWKDIVGAVLIAAAWAGLLWLCWDDQSPAHLQKPSPQWRVKH